VRATSYFQTLSLLGLSAVYEVPQNPSAVATVRVELLLAGGTPPTGSDTRDEHAVAQTKVGNRLPNRFHDSNAFMSECATGRDSRHIAFENMQVGSTNRGVGNTTIASVGCWRVGSGFSSQCFSPMP